MPIPLDIRDLLRSGAKLDAERERPVRLAVFIDAEAPDAAVEALKAALRPQTVTGRIHVEPVVPGDVLMVDSAADAVVALAGPGTTVAESVKGAREQYIPTLVLSLTEEGKDDLAARIGHPVNDVVAEEDSDALLTGLGLWLADRLAGKRLALARNFEFVRRAVATEAVKSTAMQNAVIGGVAIIPGADMPLMTANQAKMVMQIAAAYGQTLGADRIRELAGVVGGAFLLRSVARQVVTVIPGFGWAIKAGIGYSGTLAMGYAAIEYFEQGGDVRGLAEKLTQARDKAVGAARRRGHKRDVIPAQAHVVDDDVAAAYSPEPATAEMQLPPADSTPSEQTQPR